MRSCPRKRRTLQLATALAAFLSVPAAGLAGTASISGTTLVFTAGPGEINNVSVTVAANTYTFADFGVGVVSAGPGCVQAAADVNCTLAGATALNGSLLDGANRWASANVPLPTTVTGGPEGDIIGTGAGSDSIDGGDGSDSITGAAGNDTLNGGGDDDFFAGELGADTMNGGSGDDRVTYSSRSAAVSVSLDGAANDGGAGEGDNVQVDVEEIVGSSAADTLIGSAAANTLVGAGGNDSINGLGGADTIAGQDGNDTILGGGGNDSISGGPGNDTMSGEAGGDNFTGDGGADTITGGPNYDSLSYSGRNTAVSVTLDGAPNDGSPGEGDNIQPDLESFTLGEADDTFVGTSAYQTVSGDEGNDTISGLGGNDELYGNNGNDQLDGGSGDDFLDGGLDADTIKGGSGEDVANYSTRVLPVVIRLDGRAGNGEAGENDVIRSDVEHATGGLGADRITGNRGSNDLRGGGGNDIINGLGGNDDLGGGNGNDTLNPGRGQDHVSGDRGNDRISTRDGVPDDVFCGAGSDRIVTADRTGARRDRTSPDCEIGGAAR